MDRIRGRKCRAPARCFHNDRRKLRRHLGILRGFHDAPHLHKKRLTILKPKIKGLPDDHRSKPRCLYELSRLSYSVGDQVGRKPLLIHALKLWRDQVSDRQVSRTLIELSGANRLLGLHEEGIQQAKEALGVYEQLGSAAGQADSLTKLAWLLY